MCGSKSPTASIFVPLSGLRECRFSFGWRRHKRSLFGHDRASRLKRQTPLRDDGLGLVGGHVRVRRSLQARLVRRGGQRACGGRDPSRYFQRSGLGQQCGLVRDHQGQSGNASSVPCGQRERSQVKLRV